MSNTDTQLKPAAGGKKEIRTYLEGPELKDAVAKALPKHLKPDRFIRIALTAMTRTPKLAQCEPASFFQCLLSLSQYGLEPDGRRAHLIPFENKRRGVTECQLIIDWKGLAELAMRSGILSSLHADVVCENDEFEWDLGAINFHRIDFRKPRGEAYAAYAIARTKDGSAFMQVMTKDEILAVRDGSQGWFAFQKGWAKTSPWDPKHPTIEKEMWKKTPFRRLCKWLPLSAEFRDALDVEDKGEEDDRFAAAKPVFSNVTAGNLFAVPEEAEQEPEPPAEGNALARIQTLLAERNVTEATLMQYLASVNAVEAGAVLAGLPDTQLASIARDFMDLLPDLAQ